MRINLLISQLFLEAQCKQIFKSYEYCAICTYFTPDKPLGGQFHTSIESSTEFRSVIDEVEFSQLHRKFKSRDYFNVQFRTIWEFQTFLSAVLRKKSTVQNCVIVQIAVQTTFETNNQPLI